MIAPPSTVSWSRRAFVLATVITLPLATIFGAPACAATDDADDSEGDSRIVIPSNDAGSEASVDAAADVDAALVPCAVGALCIAPMPFKHASVTALNGRSKADVWASGSDGLVIHWNGLSWESLDSGITEALSTLVLTRDEAWGSSGTLVLRRALDPSTVRTLRLPISDFGIPSTIAVLPTGDAYLGMTNTSLGPLARLSFDAGELTAVPGPVLPWASEEQRPEIRASFLVPGKALWLVGDHSAVARYPIAAGEGGDDPDGGSPLGEGTLLPVASHADLLAVWAYGDELYAAGRSGTILHFNGTVWSFAETGTSVTLNAIFGTSPADIWAAGDDGTVLHFDGNVWSAVAIAGAYHGSLKAIWGSASDDVWIGGEDRIFHWGALP